MMDVRFVYTTFAVILLGLPHAKAFNLLEFTGDTLLERIEPAIQSASPEVSAERNGLRVGFYNIEMFTDGIKDDRRRTEAKAASQAKGAAAIIEDLRADILLISEIENARILSILNESMEKPYPHGYISDFGTQSGRIEKMNIGMLSRIPPVAVDEIDFGPLQGPGRPTRGIFRAIFDLGENHYLVLYSTHLKSNYGDRQKNYSQRANTMKILKDNALALKKEFPDRSWEMLVMGDFNTDPMNREFRDDPTLKVLEDWTDLWSTHPDVSRIYTMPTRYGDRFREFPPALFDRILTSPELSQQPWKVEVPSVLMKGTVTDDVKMLPGDGGHVSDHYPIYFDLKK